MVVEALVDVRDLEPIRDFIEAKVDAYSRELHSEGELSSCHEDETFGRRYAAVCKDIENPWQVVEVVELEQHG